MLLVASMIIAGRKSCFWHDEFILTIVYSLRDAASICNMELQLETCTASIGAVHDVSHWQYRGSSCSIAPQYWCLTAPRLCTYLKIPRRHPRHPLAVRSRRNWAPICIASMFTSVYIAPLDLINAFSDVSQTMLSDVERPKLDHTQ